MKKKTTVKRKILLNRQIQIQMQSQIQIRQKNKTTTKNFSLEKPLPCERCPQAAMMVSKDGVENQTHGRLLMMLILLMDYTKTILSNQAPRLSDHLESIALLKHGKDQQRWKKIQRHLSGDLKANQFHKVSNKEVLEIAGSSPLPQLLLKYQTE